MSLVTGLLGSQYALCLVSVIFRSILVKSGKMVGRLGFSEVLSGLWKCHHSGLLVSDRGMTPSRRMNSTGTPSGSVTVVTLRTVQPWTS
mmetsp:Transcript_2277/g.3914  ORF Transcript_2277/g.3914 Transcript_2277/m.3914 type:complete len:89 (-) Transcript_2277:1133-1399(-)